MSSSLSWVMASGTRVGEQYRDRLVVLQPEMLGHADPRGSSLARCRQCKLTWCGARGWSARAASARVGLVQLRQTERKYARGMRTGEGGRAERGFRTL